MITREPANSFLGGRRRSQVLILTALLDETYPRELAALLEAPVYSIQRIVDGLDKEGVFATTLLGRTRRVSLDPRFFAYKELRQLLLRLAEASPELQELAATRRSRPRRAGKPF